MTDYIDIGLNLFCRQFQNPDLILENARKHHVACILTGSDMAENRQIHAYSQTHDVYGTAGIHPHNADHARPEDFEEIRILQKNPRIVAIGECGLDFDRMFSTRENQIQCLIRHIELAESLGKPMFLHERLAARTLQEIFQDHPALCHRSIVHCFTGDAATLETYLEMGFSIGITGWICDDRRATELREAVPLLPLDRIMIETDAPYLTPRNVPGLSRVNVPENIVYVLETLARYRKVDIAVLQQAVLQNTLHFFSLPPM